MQGNADHERGADVPHREARDDEHDVDIVPV
jgi:hypothetical protein